MAVELYDSDVIDTLNDNDMLRHTNNIASSMLSSLSTYTNDNDPNDDVITSPPSTTSLLLLLKTNNNNFRSAVTTGSAAGSNSPWLWAPHVAIGALLVALMAASFVRFHCKYGHKYRTGSQSLSPSGPSRSGPQNAWSADSKKASMPVAGAWSGGAGPTGAWPAAGAGPVPPMARRTPRPAAVIVLKPVVPPRNNWTTQAGSRAVAVDLRSPPPLPPPTADNTTRRLTVGNDHDVTMLLQADHVTLEQTSLLPAACGGDAWNPSTRSSDVGVDLCGGGDVMRRSAGGQGLEGVASRQRSAVRHSDTSSVWTELDGGDSEPAETGTQAPDSSRTSSTSSTAATWWQPTTPAATSCSSQGVFAAIASPAGICLHATLVTSSGDDTDKLFDDVSVDRTPLL